MFWLEDILEHVITIHVDSGPNGLMPARPRSSLSTRGLIFASCRTQSAWVPDITLE
jgi:hypothetical protein